MDKITTEIRYKGSSYDFKKQIGYIRVFISKESDTCIMVDADDVVLFGVFAYNSQGGAYLEELELETIK